MPETSAAPQLKMSLSSNDTPALANSTVVSMGMQDTVASTSPPDVQALANGAVHLKAQAQNFQVSRRQLPTLNDQCQFLAFKHESSREDEKSLRSMQSGQQHVSCRLSMPSLLAFLAIHWKAPGILGHSMRNNVMRQPAIAYSHGKLLAIQHPELETACMSLPTIDMIAPLQPGR